MSDNVEKDVIPKKNKRFLRPLVGSKVPPVPEEQKLYPELQVNIFSRFLYHWITPLLTVCIISTFPGAIACHFFCFHLLTFLPTPFSDWLPENHH